MSVPFFCRSVFDLTKVSGLTKNHLKPGSVCFTSQRYIGVKDGREAVIIETNDYNRSFRLPITMLHMDTTGSKISDLKMEKLIGEAFLLHPTQSLMAVRATKKDKTIVQIKMLCTGSETV